MRSFVRPATTPRRDRGSGFCLLNNVAHRGAGASRRRALRARIAIVDWDVHHGDGTQRIFDADPDVCMPRPISTRSTRDRRAAREAGRGDADGTKQNRPLTAGEGDEAFVEAWRDDLLPAVEPFGPDAILVSAGYDAHRADPLAGLAVTEAGYRRWPAHSVGRLRALALGGVALTLEGGYDLDALRASSAATVRGARRGLAERTEEA